MRESKRKLIKVLLIAEKMDINYFLIKKTPSITLALNLFPRGCSALGVT